MRSKFIAAAVSVAALLVPATAMADGGSQGSSGSGGAGQAQQSSQSSATLQAALSQATAKQNAVNANAPVNVAGRDVSTGNNSANQAAGNVALSNASNDASTKQDNSQTQSDPSSSGSQGSGGTGQSQMSDQAALTAQFAASKAKADQNAVNANTPVNVAGGDINTGDNSANQLALNGAGSNASNDASTKQDNSQTQTDPSAGGPKGCGCSDGSGGSKGSGGPMGSGGSYGSGGPKGCGCSEGSGGPGVRRNRPVADVRPGGADRPAGGLEGEG